MFKIEGEGGGPSNLERTTDSEFPRTFDVIPKECKIYLLHCTSRSIKLFSSDSFVGYCSSIRGPWDRPSGQEVVALILRPNKKKLSFPVTL